MVIDKSQNTDKASFIKKNASIVLKISKGDKSRSVGIINLNLADYIDNAESQKVQKLKILKCPDKDAYLECSFKSTLLNLDAAETNELMFRNRDDLSLDSGPGSDVNFKDLNMDQEITDATIGEIKA